MRVKGAGEDWAGSGTRNGRASRVFIGTGERSGNTKSTESAGHGERADERRVANLHFVACSLVCLFAYLLVRLFVCVFQQMNC